jgi:hypothetical protein
MKLYKWLKKNQVEKIKKKYFSFGFYLIDLGLSKVHVCGPGSRTTRDVDDERVRVYVNEDNKVTTQPTVG